MDRASKEDFLEAQRVLSSLLSKCEKAQRSFAEGTSQFSLLRNRIKALGIALSLLEEELTRYN